MTTLYERIGGAPAVETAVHIFYEKVLADDRVKDFFQDLDIVAQEQKQKKFLTMVFGGPNDYTGKDMRDAHSSLGLKDEHFDAVVEDLAATLKELGVSDADIGDVATIAESVRDDVLNR